MAVGQITDPRQAEAILRSGQADMIALARGMLFNPHWAWHAAEVLGADAVYPPQYMRTNKALRGLPVPEIHLNQNRIYFPLGMLLAVKGAKLAF